MDAGQKLPCIFIWGFIKAWEIKECHRQNQLKDDPALTRRLVRHMLVHDGEQYFKAQLEQIDKYEEHIIYLQAKVTENHQEMIARQNQLKPILEGMENKK